MHHAFTDPPNSWSSVCVSALLALQSSLRAISPGAVRRARGAGLPAAGRENQETSGPFDFVRQEPLVQWVYTAGGESNTPKTWPTNCIKTEFGVFLKPSIQSFSALLYHSMILIFESPNVDGHLYEAFLIFQTLQAASRWSHSRHTGMENGSVGMHPTATHQGGALIMAQLCNLAPWDGQQLSGSLYLHQCLTSGHLRLCVNKYYDNYIKLKQNKLELSCAMLRQHRFKWWLSQSHQ